MSDDGPRPLNPNYRREHSTRYRVRHEEGRSYVVNGNVIEEVRKERTESGALWRPVYPKWDTYLTWAALVGYLGAFSFLLTTTLGYAIPLIMITLWIRGIHARMQRDYLRLQLSERIDREDA